MIIRMIVCDDHLVDLTKDLIGQAFPKLHQKRRCERRFGIKPEKADKVLVIRVLRELFHQLTV